MHRDSTNNWAHRIPTRSRLDYNYNTNSNKTEWSLQRHELWFVCLQQDNNNPLLLSYVLVFVLVLQSTYYNWTTYVSTTGNDSTVNNAINDDKAFIRLQLVLINADKHYQSSKDWTQRVLFVIIKRHVKALIKNWNVHRTLPKWEPKIYKGYRQHFL